MNNNCKVDFFTRKIVVTKKFYKSAQTYGSYEFETLLSIQNRLPGFTLEIAPALNNCKALYPSYQQMHEFIELTTKDDVAVNKLHEIIELARINRKGYNMVRRWFMDRYGHSYCNEEPDSFCQEEVA